MTNWAKHCGIVNRRANPKALPTLAQRKQMRDEQKARVLEKLRK